ncbi:MAG: ParB N-terminal domain-containing protein [Bacteroidota bacterium]
MDNNISVLEFGLFGESKLSLDNLLDCVGPLNSQYMDFLIKVKEFELKIFAKNLLSKELSYPNISQDNKLHFVKIAETATRILKTKAELIQKEIQTKEKGILNIMQADQHMLIGESTLPEHLIQRASIRKLKTFEEMLVNNSCDFTIDELDETSILDFDRELADKVKFKDRIKEIPFSELKIAPVFSKIISTYEYNPDYTTASDIPKNQKDFCRLVDDIRLNKMTEPIMVDKDFTIINGNKRYRALQVLKATNENIEVLVTETYENRFKRNRKSELELYIISNYKPTLYWEAYPLIRRAVDDEKYKNFSSYNININKEVNIKEEEKEAHDSHLIVADTFGISKAMVRAILNVGDVISTYFKGNSKMDYFSQINNEFEPTNNAGKKAKKPKQMSITVASQQCDAFKKLQSKMASGEITPDKFQDYINALSNPDSDTTPIRLLALANRSEASESKLTEAVDVQYVFAKVFHRRKNGTVAINIDDILFEDPDFSDETENESLSSEVKNA